MKRMSPLSTCITCLAMLLTNASDAATPQPWPAKSLRFVMTAPAGSSIDAIGRIIGDKLRVLLGQPIIARTGAKVD